VRDEIADLDERIAKQIEALEQGVEPQLVSKRIEKLRRAKKPPNRAPFRALSPAAADSGASEDASALLARLPEWAQPSETHPSN
jgi:hypothetical protein